LKTFSGDGSGSAALSGFEKKLTGYVPPDEAIPNPVLKAVRLMLLGGAITLVTGVFSVIAVLSDPKLFNAGKLPSSTQLTQAIVYYIVSALVFVAVWVVMARANRAGQPWARIVATVLFVISSYNLYQGINSLTGGETILVLNVISFVLAVTEWICGLIAIALIWRGESSVYFKQRSIR
jgi:predicted Co/Zn/Cd cation transporter (cation efflux family)